MALVTLCLALASCSDDTFNREYGEGMGYLRLQLGKVDVDLSSTTRAEAGSLPNELIPATADFMIDIKQGSTSVDDFPKKYSELSEEGIELKAGAYTVIAYSGENEPIQDTPYFSGSSTIEIYPGKSAETTINAALANAMLVPAVSESLRNHYENWTLTIKAGKSSMKLADNENADGYLFTPAGQSVNAVFEGTNRLGKETSPHEWTVISPAVAQTKYVIQCDPDLSIFSNIQLTATATHTYADNVLTGTNVTLNIEDNGAPLELVDSWNIQLFYNGKPIRTYAAKPENGTLMEVTDGWPYVPQGSTLTASIHLRTGETIDITSAILEEIPKPEFTTTVSGNTSYSVYQNSGAEEANKKDGSSIFDINATATIAQEILENYSDLLKVTYTIDDNEQSTKESTFGIPTEFNSLAWQKHTLTASVTFDGVEITSSPVECDVTGLPYTPSAMVEADWENASWNYRYENGTIQLGGVSGSGECTATSKMAFYIPENIGVKVNTNVTIRASHILWWQNTTFTVNINGTTIISQYSDKQDNDNTGKNYTLSGTGIFSPNACEVKLNSSYEAAGPWSKVHTLHILYN